MKKRDFLHRITRRIFILQVYLFWGKHQVETLRMGDSAVKTADFRVIEGSSTDNLQLSRSRIVRWLLITAGSICVALAFIGILIPILPTTPFLLLASACFARSSERFYNWMIENPYFGRFIRDWREKKGIPLVTKYWAISLLTLTLGSSIVLFIPLVPVKVGLAVVGVAVSTYIWRLPTREVTSTEY